MFIQFTDDELDDNGGYLGEGDFDVRITKVEEALSASGNPKVILTLTDSKGRIANDHIPMTEKTKFRIREVAMAAGIDRETMKVGFDVSRLQGRKVKLTRKNLGTREGQKYPDWSNSYASCGDDAMDSMEGIPH